jgi:signal recognition particle subunit SRP54
MLGTLTAKMQSLVGKLAGKQKLTEENVADAVSEVRLALLEADVAYGVAKQLVRRIKEKALGDLVLKSVTPGQQFVKLVHDELVALMGGDEASLDLSKKPAVIMLCGLQGAGKTTQCAKLARYLIKKGLAKKPMLAACDLQRPAAIQQLELLGKQIGVPVFTLPGENDPVAVARQALAHARAEQCDLLVLDTAGRLHIDEELMLQLERVKKIAEPSEILFVANAATGQDAVNVAAAFDSRIAITGSILTMLDGNTRGGAAISIREVTGKPLLFEGVGEKIDDLQLFNPTSMADRILGMGDTINLVKMAKEHIDEDEAKKMEKKLRTATFTYEDFLSQMQMLKKLGSLKGLLGMLPGMNAIKDMDLDEKGFFKNEAMILSMTQRERAHECELTVSRRKRIAAGSGTSLDDVNKLVKTFERAMKFFKNMPNMKQLEKMMGGTPWR